LIFNVYYQFLIILIIFSSSYSICLQIFIDSMLNPYGVQIEKLLFDPRVKSRATDIAPVRGAKKEPFKL